MSLSIWYENPQGRPKAVRPRSFFMPVRECQALALTCQVPALIQRLIHGATQLLLTGQWGVRD